MRHTVDVGARPRHAGHAGHGRRTLSAVVAMALSLAIATSACSAGGSTSQAASRQPPGTQTPGTGRPTTSSPRSPVAPALRSSADVQIVRATTLTGSGSPAELCRQAVNATPSGRGWTSRVVKTAATREILTGRPVRWVFCTGDAASGIGTIALRTAGRAWRIASIGIGPQYHAGDVLAVDVIDGTRASVTFVSLLSTREDFAITDDGGRTWSVVNVRSPDATAGAPSPGTGSAGPSG